MAFAQIYKIQGYGQYKMHRSIINVLANVNETQSILPHLPQDDSIIGVFLKRRLEYKSPYLSRNVRPNLIMFALNDLLKPPLYKELNIKICKYWKGLFAMHKQSKFENVEVPNDTSTINGFDNDTSTQVMKN